jgi:ABC-type lipoprotein release transport system permease subunit
MKKELQTAFFMATRDISKDKRIFALVLFALAFSYVNLIFFASMLEGITVLMENQTINNQTSHIIIVPKEGEKFIDDVFSTEKRLNLIQGIHAVSPRLGESATITYREKSFGTEVSGIIPSKENNVTQLSKNTIGEFLGDGDTGEILLGEGVADMLMEEPEDDQRVPVGGKVYVTYSNGVRKEYHVKGIIYTKFPMVDEVTTLVTIREMESVLGVSNKASRILVRLESPEDMEGFIPILMQAGVDGDLRTWKIMSSEIEEISTSFGIITDIVSSVALLTAAMTMAIIVYINTSHKRRQIGILKAIGASDSVILLIFLFEAFMFGIFGILAGLMIVYWLIGVLSQNPIPLPLGYVVPIVKANLIMNTSAALFATTLVSAFYPAWRASKTNIIKSIWGG